MPNAKKLAAELGVSLNDVKPSNGEFIKAADVAAAAERKPSAPAVNTEAENVVPTARIRRTLARRWDESAKIPSFSVSVTVDSASVDAVTAMNAEVGT